MKLVYFFPLCGIIPLFPNFFSILLQDKSSTSNLKIEALIFTRLVLASHSPPVFHPHIKVLAVTMNFIYLFIFISNLISLKSARAQLMYIGSIKNKYLNRKRKNNHKVMKARNMKVIIDSHPVVKGIKEKSFNSTMALLPFSKLQ